MEREHATSCLDKFNSALNKQINNDHKRLHGDFGSRLPLFSKVGYWITQLPVEPVVLIVVHNELNYVYNNSIHPSDFSIGTNSIKKFSSLITSMSVPKSVERCSVRS